MELREAFSTVQGNLDRGDYATVVDACTRVLDIFPSCVTAHRMLGEAWLEQGQVDPAQEHFARTLAIDPANVVARLGLGVVAEERHDLATAYKHYLNAWEINPALDQLRDELVRVQGQLGGDGRIHPTRSALAVIYGRGGHRERALREWRAVVGADANNLRASLAMAELLWEAGDVEGAKAACDAVLARLPEAARALLILAAIDERQRGHIARDTVDRYLAVDPAAELAAAFVVAHAGTTLGDILAAPVTIDEGSIFSAPPAEAPTAARQDVVVEAARPTPLPHRVPFGAPTSSQIAAPDIWGSSDDSARGGAAGGADAELSAEPFSWDDFADQIDGGASGPPSIPSGGAPGTGSLVGSRSGMLSGDDLDAVFGRVGPDAAPTPSATPDVDSDPFAALRDLTMGFPVPEAPSFASDQGRSMADPLTGTPLPVPSPDRTGTAPLSPAWGDLDDLGVIPFSFDLDTDGPNTIPGRGGAGVDASDTSELDSRFDFALDADIEPFNFDLDVPTPGAARTTSGSAGTDLFGRADTSPAMGGGPLAQSSGRSVGPVSGPAGGEGTDDLFGGFEDLLNAAASDRDDDLDALPGGLGGGSVRPDAAFDMGAFEPFDLEPFAPAAGTPTPTDADVFSAASGTSLPSESAWSPIEVPPAPLAPIEPVAPRQDMMARSGPSPFVKDDGRIDLTVGWDDLDRALEDATPPATSVEGYDDLLLDLSADGIAPLELGDFGDDDSWEPLSADDWDTEESPAVVEPNISAPFAAAAPDAWRTVSPAVGERDPGMTDDVMPFEFDVLDQRTAQDTLQAGATEPNDAALQITAGWDDIDEELARAIPQGSMDGYTELLKNLDSEHPMPFSDAEFGGAEAEVDPLAPKDAAGDQIDFEDLFAVTGEDRAAPLEHPSHLESVIESLADSSVAPADPWGHDIISGTVDVEVVQGDATTAEERGIDPFDGTDDQVVAHETLSPDTFDFFALDEVSDQGTTDGPVDGVDGATASWEALLTSSTDQATDAHDTGSEVATAALSSVDESDRVVPDPQAGTLAGNDPTEPEAFSFDDWTVTRDLGQGDDQGQDQPAGSPATAVAGTDVTAPLPSSPPTPTLDATPETAERSAGGTPVFVGSGGSASVWPPFDNGAVSIGQVDRFDLFGRLREEKQSLVALGMLSVNRTMQVHRPVATGLSGTAELRRAGARRSIKPQTGGLTPEQLNQIRADIAGSRSDVLHAVAQLEPLAAAGGGTQVQRLLGEGYLRLGRSAEAAEQFHLAMSYQNR